MRRLLLATLPIFVAAPLLFRRSKDKASRDDVFEELFILLARGYEQAARLKPEWREEWRVRADGDLPPKYAFGDRIATLAALDMRFATALLQRNRWKSKVQPLFDSYDTAAWSAYQGFAANISVALLDLADERIELLLADERDWIAAAIEQFDEATRRRREADRAGTALTTLVAEGTYQVLYITIQLSDRLIERRRFMAEQRR